MIDETAHIQTPQADWRGREYATGNMRFAVEPGTNTKPSILQQEWAVEWGNNMGEMLTTQWVDVPLVVVDAKEPFFGSR